MEHIQYTLIPLIKFFDQLIIFYFPITFLCWFNIFQKENSDSQRFQGTHSFLVSRFNDNVWSFYKSLSCKRITLCFIPNYDSSALLQCVCLSVNSWGGFKPGWLHVSWLFVASVVGQLIPFSRFCFLYILSQSWPWQHARPITIYLNK